MDKDKLKETKPVSIYRKLQTARVMLAEKNLPKSGENKFAGYKYFELSDFLPEIQRIFSELGMIGIVNFSNPAYAELSIVDVDTGEAITFTSPMAEANLKGAHPIQNVGAVQTYQRRYLYMMALEITEPEAIDSSAGADPKIETKPKTKPPVPDSIYRQAVDALNKGEMFTKKGQPIQEWLKMYYDLNIDQQAEIESFH